MPVVAFAQVTPAAGFTPPDDTPSIRVGVTMYPNFTAQSNPTITDADGNVVNKSSFDVSRAYVNVTGNISHIVNFRITPEHQPRNQHGEFAGGQSRVQDQVRIRPDEF